MYMHVQMDSTYGARNLHSLYYFATYIPQNGLSSTVFKKAKTRLFAWCWSALYPIRGHAPSQEKHFPSWKSFQLSQGKAFIAHGLLMEDVK